MSNNGPVRHVSFILFDRRHKWFKFALFIKTPFFLKLYNNFTFSELIARMKTANALFLLSFLTVIHLFGSNPPGALGTWRVHLPYNNVKCIEETKDKIYCAGTYGLFSYDKADGTTERLSPINGFSGYSADDLAYDEASNSLLIAYSDCKLEIIRDKTIVLNEDIFNKTIIGAKKINHINIVGNIAYISTTFGLLEFDFIKNEIRNSYLNIGPNGTTIAINSSCVLNDSVYVCTPIGILRGSTNSNVNLGIYTNWSLAKAAAKNSRHIASFNNMLFAEIDSQVYKYKNKKWSLYDPGSNLIITNIKVNHGKLLVGIYGKYIITEDESGNTSTTPVNVLNECILESGGTYAYASPINGLSRIIFGQEFSYYPNGPSSVTNFNIFNAYGDLWITSGSFVSTTYAPTFNGYKYYRFNNFDWQNYNSDPITQSLHDYTWACYQKSGNRLFIGTHGKGLLQMNNGVPYKVWDETNSPLTQRGGIYTIINGLASDSKNNLWVSNFDVDNALLMMTPNGDWTSFTLPTSKTGKIAIDSRGNKWIVTPQASMGIIAFNEKNIADKTDDIITVINTTKGSGNLPSSNVNDIAFTKSGELLIGTDQGFVKIRTPSNALNPNAKAGDYDAQRVIVSVETGTNLGGYLLGSEIINCIVVDGGDRRWFGTNRGAWLYDSDGETLLLHFTTDNSPLMSNNVTSIGISETTGEVFFGTDKGVVSYRGDALAAGKTFTEMKIYPNPVKPEYSGDIAITGMTDNTLVKITDINGRLVNQMFSNGAMAVWNGKNFNGDRVATGVYLVFCINQEGTEEQVGKILFVH